MLQKLKKVTSASLILFLFADIVPGTLFDTAHAALAPTFLVNNDAANTKSYNPGQTFSMDVTTTNDVGEAIKSAYANVTFGNNSAFSYKGVDQRTRISGVVITNPVPSSAYSSTTGFSYEITNASNLTIAPSAAFWFNRASNSHTGFVISNSISTYQNTLSASFTAQKTSDSSTVTSSTVTKTIFVNVRPHITYYDFQSSDGSTTTNSIQGDNSQTIKLVVKAKDYNGCTNIDQGSVTANLSSIGLGSSESLSYVSCESDGMTAVFEKTGISTVASLGTYTFTTSSFTATDEDGNVNTVSDPNTLFDDEDKKTDISLAVIASTTPRLTVTSEGDYVIGGAGQTSSTISFSGSQDGSIMVARGSDGSCSGGSTISGWTAGYLSGTTTSVTVQSSSLVAGANNVYVCLQNASGSIGSFYRTITLDTTAPTTSAVLANAATVTTNNTYVSFSCNEAGSFAGEIGGNGTLGNGVGSSGWTTTTANTTNTYTVLNANLTDGANTVYGYCRDDAGNISHGTTTVTRSSAPISMSGTVSAFSDSDSNYDGLDGRDITMTWTNSGVSGSNFQSYRIYLLPSNITFSSGSHTYVKLITDVNTTQFTGDATLTKDSTNSDLISGASYKVCIAIMGQNIQLGEEGCSSPTVLTADTVTHPTVLSAKFTSDTNLELTTDSTLTGTTSAHSGALVTFVRNGATLTGTNISSVNGTKLNVTIPSLGSLAATGGTLIVATGAINANGGGYNNYFSSGSLQITDGQAPTVTGFATGTVSPYGGFYSGSLALTFQFAETMSGAGNTKIYFTRVGGNTDASPTKIYNITNASDLTSGTKTVTVDLTTLSPTSLVSGAYYSVYLVGQDLVGNTVTSNTISPIKFDNVGPAVPSVTALTILSTLTPTFDWLAPLDDNGNGSGIQRYNLSVYNGLSCATTAIQSPTTTGLSYTLLTALPTDVASYSWRLSATDNMGNTGSGSACDDFTVNTTTPTISNQKITDTTLSSTSVMKSGDAIQVSATIPSSNSSHIWLDASSITASSSHTGVLCSSPGAGISCTYSSNVVTYSFTAGFAGSISNGTRQVQFRAQNVSGGNEQTAIASITSDSTAPTVGSVITAPIGSTVWGGTSQTITWNSAGVTDNIGISYVKLEYSSDGGSNFSLIGTGANNGSYVWNVSALTTGANYQVRLTAYDAVGNNTSVTSSTFSIDKVAPTISAGTITAPTTGAYVRGGQATTVVWTTGNITDNATLPSSPITLHYSTDGGTNWTQIVAGTTNSGTYAWTAPSSTNTTQARVRLTATDSAGNTSTLSTANFIIDSTNPSLSVTYAGAGGSTPVNGKYVNNSGIDVSGMASDSYLSGAVYTFQNLSNSQYWDGSSWTASQTWNALCTGAASCTISSTISPTIANGTSYRLTVRSIDLAGNTTTANPIDYVGDTTAPTVSVSTASGTYFSGSLTISGTSSDAASGLSSVKIAIKKGSNWWNGTDWSAVSEVQLATTTSNSYASWSYAFTPLSSDTSGQQYVATTYSYDQAYKTNNSSTGAITVTIDKTAPSINTSGFWIEPPFANAGTGGVMRGGQSATVRWNSGSISDALSGLSSSSVKLEYFNGASYVAIAGASALANSGSFSWSSLPSLDTTSYVLMTVTDALGNSTGTISPSFVIDSTPPTVSSVTTVGDTLGKINGLTVRFSEDVNTSAISAANFSYSLGTVNSASFTIVDAQTIQLALTTATGTTASTGILTYSGTSVTDIAGNNLVNVTKTVVDGASPIVSSAEVLDNDSNGKIDRIRVYWSENLTSSTDTTAWTITNPLAWVGTAPTSVSTSANVATLVINEPTGLNTSTGGMSIAFVSNANWKDVSAALNAASSAANTTLSDAALPIISSVATSDVSGVYAIDLTLSESIAGTLTGFTLSGSSTYTGTISQPSSTALRLVTTDSTATDTAKSYVLTYAGSGIALRDAANNYVANFSNRTVSDGVAPKILARTTLDSDGNGKLDGVRVGFSESVSSTAGVTISVAWYVVTGYSTSGTGVTATVTEWSLADTSATPAIQFQNTTLADSAGNIAASEISTTNVTDAIGPVITSVIFDGMDTLSLEFSETVSGSYTATAFVISGATASISSASIVNGASTGAVTLSNSGVTTGSSELSFSGNTVADGLWNKQSGKAFAKISPTVIINEVMWSSTGSSASQYIELHNLGNSTADISGWKIDYAATNGSATLTLPAAQTIAAGGYYLITSTAIANASNLLAGTSDYAGSLSLDPAQTNSLVLKNTNNTVYDRALAPWPYGTGSLPASMERKSIPGNGLTASNWYTAQTGSGFFDVVGPLGTPRSANVFDATAPTISSVTPTDNTLRPSGTVTLSYAYSDTIGMAATPTYSFKLEKNTGTGAFTDVTASSLSSSGINAATASFVTNSLSSGHYRTTFTINDAAGNQTQDVSNFYLDTPSLTVSAPSYEIGNLQAGSLTTGTGQITVTVQTIGAGFSLSLGGSGTMQAGISQIAAWSGALSNGFGFTSTPSGSATTSVAFSPIAPTTLESVATNTGYLSNNGNLKTYTYTVQLGAKVTSLQAAGNYAANTNYQLQLQY